MSLKSVEVLNDWMSFVSMYSVTQVTFISFKEFLSRNLYLVQFGSWIHKTDMTLS